jgi:hypothetical protein
LTDLASIHCKQGWPRGAGWWVENAGGWVVSFWECFFGSFLKWVVLQGAQNQVFTRSCSEVNSFLGKIEIVELSRARGLWLGKPFGISYL